jgi:thiamine kinase-like enzyme
LQKNGTIKQSTVVSFSTTRVGEETGFTGGGLYRYEIEYDAFESKAPSSLIVKTSPTDLELRELFKGFNQREAQFFSAAAPQYLPIPNCYYASSNFETGESILLLEDLKDYRVVDILTGCNRQEVELVITSMADIHAYWWQDARLKNFSGAEFLLEIPFDELWAEYPQKVAELLPDFQLPPLLLDIGRLAVAKIDRIFNHLNETAVITCIHRDLHVDNILFGAEDAIILDWQCVGRGRAAYDISYFMISSVPIHLRREIEQEMLQLYYRTLIEKGVTNYSFESCWLDYRLAMITKLHISLLATVRLDNETPHKKAWRRRDLERLIAFCEDHSIEAFLKNF